MYQQFIATAVLVTSYAIVNVADANKDNLWLSHASTYNSAADANKDNLWLSHASTYNSGGFAFNIHLFKEYPVDSKVYALSFEPLMRTVDVKRSTIKGTYVRRDEGNLDRFGNVKVFSSIVANIKLSTMNSANFIKRCLPYQTSKVMFRHDEIVLFERLPVQANGRRQLRYVGLEHAPQTETEQSPPMQLETTTIRNLYFVAQIEDIDVKLRFAPSYPFSQLPASLIPILQPFYKKLSMLDSPSHLASRPAHHHRILCEREFQDGERMELKMSLNDQPDKYIPAASFIVMTANERDCFFGFEFTSEADDTEEIPTVILGKNFFEHFDVTLSAPDSGRNNGIPEKVHASVLERGKNAERLTEPFTAPRPGRKEVKFVGLKKKEIPEDVFEFS